MAQACAVVIGAGIGGLAAAAGLCSAGWTVTVCDRVSSLEPVGVALGLAPNGLRALDVIGAGDVLRELAVPQEVGFRRSDGRWLVRSTTRQVIADRFGDAIILLPRAAVIDALAARVPPGVLSLATEVTSVEPGGQEGPGVQGAARVVTTAGELEADLVVAADGIGSVTRSALFPDHPGLRYAGFTTWRLLTGPVTGQVPMAESWGRGTVFGVMPLSDGRRPRRPVSGPPTTSWPSWPGYSAGGTSRSRGCSRAPCRGTSSATTWPSWPGRCRRSTAAGSPCSATPPIR
jgi:2-polyprenyl-6-methoxyphenol hydroxylase-like FAD-dependent oxidoreductase